MTIWDATLANLLVTWGLQTIAGASGLGFAEQLANQRQTASRKVLIEMEEPRFRDIAATVYSESSHVPDESEGIARIIRNRAEWRGVSLSATNLFERIGGSGMYGRSGSSYATMNGVSVVEWQSMEALGDRAATIRGLVQGRDLTRGSYFWEATGSLSNPTHPWRKDKWVGGTDPHYIFWEEKFIPVFRWQADLGATSFFRYNYANPTYSKSVYP